MLLRGPAGPGALARRVLRNGPGTDPGGRGRPPVGGGPRPRAGPACSLPGPHLCAAACSPSSSHGPRPYFCIMTASSGHYAHTGPVALSSAFLPAPPLPPQPFPSLPLSVSLSLDQTWSWESQTLSLSKHFSTGFQHSPRLRGPRHQVRLSQPHPGPWGRAWGLVGSELAGWRQGPEARPWGVAGAAPAGQTEKTSEAEDPGHEARSQCYLLLRDPETGLGRAGAGSGAGTARECPPPPEQQGPSALPRPLHAGYPLKTRPCSGGC